ncbi:hypothetical protein FDP41_013511 [Naegleria fowleri]|uniref:SH3 domain-containing protein n=1 Tax=Naegleria fowleri TaxID=5763 RepID=A0A6A5BSZ2_NAEFO|nr:uncharacterized protein FDP41_013511 [Naegleria fowleri]KAF0980297.1 hypothetical protein FDP41_013511 [Naegleria fowleri]
MNNSQQDTTTCKVLYDFKADGENELSVSKGEIVRLISIHGEWMMVEKMTKPFQKGYVPTLYISLRNSATTSESRSASSRKSSKSNVSSSTVKKDQQNNSSSVISNNSEKQSIPSDVQPSSTSKQQASEEGTVAATSNSKDISTDAQLSVGNSTTTIAENKTSNSTQQNVTLPSTVDSVSTQATIIGSKNMSEQNAKRNVATPSQNLGKTARSTKSMTYATKIGNELEESLSVLQAYEANEKIFKQTLQQREEAFKRIEQKLDKICQDVNEFQQRNDLLIERIKNLDNRIENDRLRLIEGITEPLESEIMNEPKTITKTPIFIERKRRTLANLQTPLN